MLGIDFEPEHDLPCGFEQADKGGPSRGTRPCPGCHGDPGGVERVEPVTILTPAPIESTVLLNRMSAPSRCASCRLAATQASTRK